MSIKSALSRKYGDQNSTVLTNVDHCSAVKGTVSRDFRPSVFFHQNIRPGLLIKGLKPFRIQIRIREDIRIF
jgi:hypothetical protein